MKTQQKRESAGTTESPGLNVISVWMPSLPTQPMLFFDHRDVLTAYIDATETLTVESRGRRMAAFAKGEWSRFLCTIEPWDDLPQMFRDYRQYVEQEL